MKAFAWPTIARGDRVVFVGPSGSGKTELLKALLVTRRNAIVLDTKGVEDWSMVGTPIARRELARIRGGRFIYTVPDDLIVTPDAQSALLLALLRAGDRVVALDELYDWDATHGLKLLATKGRASKVGMWVGTQRPTHVPLFALTEAQHFFVFGLRLKADQQRMDQATGTQIPWNALRSLAHHFCYISGNGTLHAPARLDLS